MISRFFAALLLGLLFATPAAAEWSLRQSDGFAKTTTGGPGYRLEIWCRRGQPLQLALTALGSNRDFRGVKGLMMWLTRPDGRTDRWPVDVSPEGPALTGRLIVSEFNLDFFRYGQTFVLDAPGKGLVFMEGGMKGTGAARLAFKEQCGI